MSDLESTNEDWLSTWSNNIKRCKDCPLGCGNAVVGSGNLDAPLLIVGEAPGEDEVLQGIPFVGKSGKDLRQIFYDVGLLPEMYYLTNSVHCRPTKAGYKGRLVNRSPTKAESLACHPYLMLLVERMHPTVVLAVGAKATEATRGLVSSFGFELVSITHPAARYRMSAANSEVAYINMVEGVKQAKYLANILQGPQSPGVFQ